MSGPVTPAMLSDQQKKALGLVARPARMYRIQGGYGHHPWRITLAVASSLTAIGLVKIDRTTGPHPFPVLTGSGRTLLAVIEERRRRA